MNSMAYTSKEHKEYQRARLNSERIKSITEWAFPNSPTFFNYLMEHYQLPEDEVIRMAGKLWMPNVRIEQAYLLAELIESAYPDVSITVKVRKEVVFYMNGKKMLVRIEGPVTTMPQALMICLLYIHETKTKQIG